MKRLKQPTHTKTTNTDTDFSSVPVSGSSGPQRSRETEKSQHLKRLQQPPANINTNLMKVKMECDYVPIKKEAEQEVEEDNNYKERRSASSPSFPHENSNSTQNGCQDNHDSERAKQQEQVVLRKFDLKQQKQKQVTELIENLAQMFREKLEEREEMKTRASKLEREVEELERKKEKLTGVRRAEIIAQVKGLIPTLSVTGSPENEELVARQHLLRQIGETLDKKKTLKNEISTLEKDVSTILHQMKENTHENNVKEMKEIQRTLKKEIYQLKLVNGQQQTNINALNSIITLQWTENNELRAKVAEQQQQIEELKNKLK